MEDNSPSLIEVPVDRFTKCETAIEVTSPVQNFSSQSLAESLDEIPVVHKSQIEVSSYYEFQSDLMEWALEVFYLLEELVGHHFCPRTFKILAQPKTDLPILAIKALQAIKSQPHYFELVDSVNSGVIGAERDQIIIDLELDWSVKVSQSAIRGYLNTILKKDYPLCSIVLTDSMTRIIIR